MTVQNKMATLWSLSGRMKSVMQMGFRSGRISSNTTVPRFHGPLAARIHKGLDTRRYCSSTEISPGLAEGNGRVAEPEPKVDLQENGQLEVKTPPYDFLQDQPYFTDFPLDKLSHLRKNRDLMFEFMKSKDAKIVFFHKNLCLFYSVTKISPNASVAREDLTADGSYPTSKPVILHPLNNYKDMIDNKVGMCFLGKDEGGAPVFSASIKAELHVTLAEEEEGWFWKEVAKEASRMSKADGALLAFVNGMMDFHVKNVNCGKTGQKTGAVFGGHGRAHKSYEGLAKTPHHLRPHVMYPRIDPAVIVLVLSGDYVLLGRKKSWAISRYSLLAGFSELGESLEQACVREVKEESDVVIRQSTLQYMGSQPWPFPHSLMVGFEGRCEHIDSTKRAQSFPYTLSPYMNPRGIGLDRVSSKAKAAALETNVTPEEMDRYLGICLPVVTPDKSEIADARWFHVDFLRKCLEGNSGPVTVPGHHSMARRSLESWLRRVEKSENSWRGATISDVAMDAKGRFKYVLLRVSDDQGNSKIVVRGSKKATYHSHLKESFERMESRGLSVEALGGGRIEHDADQQLISIFGYSSAYGTAVHEIAGVICQRWFPNYDSRMIKVSYEGY
ncbi:hypothetical protein BSKO_05873 [Bryopsis sp. KO-2023]|nr:hypothetical protein BSKO_05873 [Bryopsis sp. KO-2023]